MIEKCNSIMLPQIETESKIAMTQGLLLRDKPTDNAGGAAKVRAEATQGGWP